jgi:16S rRNA (guanine966-N2)-methyltransferase
VRRVPGTLRIVAGELRGRRVRVPPGVVRPTADRVREAVFSILGPLVDGAAVLDLYAGSGALALEALSRGAARAVCVEADRDAAAVLRDNVQALGLAGRCRVVERRAAELRGVALGGPFDLVFADPPYGGTEHPVIAALAPLVLAATGVLVLEREAGDGAAPLEWPDLERARVARYGRTALELYRWTAGRITPDDALARR